MSNLALVLRDQGKYEEAEEMHRQAIRLHETVLGKEHSKTLISTDNPAFAKDCFRWTSALSYFIRCMEHAGHNTTSLHGEKSRLEMEEG